MTHTTHTTEDQTYTITTRIGTYYNEAGDMRIIEAHDESGELASELYADLETGQIMQLETREENRREGLATALVTFATVEGIDLAHSPAEHCTEEGLAFAESTTDIEVIEEDLAYQPN